MSLGPQDERTNMLKSLQSQKFSNKIKLIFPKGNPVYDA